MQRHVVQGNHLMKKKAKKKSQKRYVGENVRVKAHYNYRGEQIGIITKIENDHAIVEFKNNTESKLQERIPLSRLVFAVDRNEGNNWIHDWEYNLDDDGNYYGDI